jgi:hypothetical protein
MSNINTVMNAYHIRLELLKMAKDMLTDEYYGKRELANNGWQTDIETARLKGADLPKHPGFPEYPSGAQIIEKANQLNQFVSQPTTQLKTGKKST